MRGVREGLALHVCSCNAPASVRRGHQAALPALANRRIETPRRRKMDGLIANAACKTIGRADPIRWPQARVLASPHHPPRPRTTAHHPPRPRTALTGTDGFSYFDRIGRARVYSEKRIAALSDAIARIQCLLSGAARDARAFFGSDVVFQGAMVSKMIFTPAKALSISPCTRPTSDLRNACSC
jgi:hypothetical protein